MSQSWKAKPDILWNMPGLIISYRRCKDWSYGAHYVTQGYFPSANFTRVGIRQAPFSQVCGFAIPLTVLSMARSTGMQPAQLYKTSYLERPYACLNGLLSLS